MGFSLPVMLASYLVTFLSYRSQRNEYRHKLQERERRYQARLQNLRQRLEEARERQRAALCENDPDLQRCLALVEQRDPRRLWARAPRDEDFLTLRLGIGQRPFSVAVKPPRQEATEGGMEPDPLFDAAWDLATDFAQVPSVPITLPLRQAGVAGLAGPRGAVLNLARVLALQVATHHAPNEVKVVAIYPEAEAEEWDWIRWLPHVWTEGRERRLLAREKGTAHDLLMTLYDQLHRRLLRPQDDAEHRDAPPLPCFVLFLTDPRLVEGEPILPLLLREGPRVGAFPIFLADAVEALPKGCRAIVRVGAGGYGQVQTTPTAPPHPYEPDQVSPEEADRFARTMAPIRLQHLTASAEVPGTVSLLDLLGVERVEELDLLTRWRQSEPFRSLAVPIGRKAGGELLYLDFHERGHGPHGLGAGTTGSGKSELLQALVASLAVHFHPHEVAFVLIDYKGGGMANAFQGLPHLVGTITNLQGGLAIRALSALKAELKRRQRLFNQAGVTNIDAYQQRYRRREAPEPLPHLILIADEFAELVQEQPDFMKELISATRIGRSLGVHLLLTTQKPAGVVNEQIWTNTRFRFCLRVERPEDSQDVLRRPDAAGLPHHPGRGYFQVGNNEVFELFQAAWGGAPYAPGSFVVRDPYEIVEVTLEGERRPLGRSPRPRAFQERTTQLQALVAYIREVAKRAGITALPGPWLPPLPERITLEEVLAEVRPSEGWDGQTWQPATAWLEPVVGLVDDPANQQQRPLRLPLGEEGHLAVYGAPGTGKTTFLQTLITALARTHSPQEVHLYLLDFGGRLLTLFAPLPHVGGVVLMDEEEKLQRLFRFLLREMDRRKEQFARAGVGTLTAYRETTGDPMPALVVVLDNYTAFATPGAEEELEMLAQITREGGSLGVHLVLTANSPSLVKTKISNNITLAVALQLADPGDYGMAVGRTGGLVPAAVPGRGLVKGKPPLEFQTALPVAGDTEARRTEALKGLIERMAQAWKGPVATPIPVLPKEVALAELLPPGSGWLSPAEATALAVPVGLDVDDLEPIEVDLADGPHFLIAGPIQSGKTTFLQTWLLALAERFPPERLRLYLADFQGMDLLPLQGLPHVQAYITDDDRLGEALAEIERSLEERRQALEEARRRAGGLLSGEEKRGLLAGYPALVLAVSDFETFNADVQGGTKERLKKLIRQGRGLGFHLLLAGVASALSSSYEDWVKALKAMPTGFLLGSSEHNDLQLFNLRLPMGEAGQLLPPGQGYYAQRRRYRRIKAATGHVGDVTLKAWGDLIIRRGKGEVKTAARPDEEGRRQEVSPPGRETQERVTRPWERERTPPSPFPKTQVAPPKQELPGEKKRPFPTRHPPSSYRDLLRGLIGERLGRYRIDEEIGRGGMAIVFRAYDPVLDRDLAIKVLLPEYSLLPNFTKRFEREARAIARLSHPNILPIIDFGQERDLSYIVMKYVRGETLRERMGRPMDLAQAVRFVGQIAAALDHAHRRGVIHRDVKPSNVLLDEGDWVLLTDFGLAKLVIEADQEKLTRSDAFLGTLAYASPEQGLGKKPVDHRTDIYSLGVILYEMATGRLPYEADTPVGIAVKHIHEPPPRPRQINPAIPEEVEAVILKAMAKEPDERYDSAGAMARALRKAVGIVA